MVILVLYVGYKRGLHFIYLFAVLIETNTVVVFLPESAYLKKKKRWKFLPCKEVFTVIKQTRDPLVTILEMYS